MQGLRGGCPQVRREHRPSSMAAGLPRRDSRWRDTRGRHRRGVCRSAGSPRRCHWVATLGAVARRLPARVQHRDDLRHQVPSEWSGDRRACGRGRVRALECPCPPLSTRCPTGGFTPTTPEMCVAAKTSDGFAVAAYGRDTGALRWGPTQLPRGSLPAKPVWVEVDQGETDRLPWGGVRNAWGGGLLRDVGIWKIDDGGAVTWGPVVTASPPGPNSNDGIDDLLMEEAEVCGFRGPIAISANPARGASYRGWTRRMAMYDGKSRGTRAPSPTASSISSQTAPTPSTWWRPAGTPQYPCAFTGSHGTTEPCSAIASW
jgi:hypothetical protein